MKMLFASLTSLFICSFLAPIAGQNSPQMKTVTAEQVIEVIIKNTGVPGSQAHFAFLRSDDVDVVLAGEVPQWETYEYMRDAVIQGRKKAIVFLGHVNSEEAGMQFCAEWLKGFIKNVPVHFVASGPSYWSY